MKKIVVLLSLVLGFVLMLAIATQATVQYAVTQIYGIDPTQMTFPNAINNHGQVTGKSINSYGVQRAFIWQDGVTTDIGAFCDPSLTDSVSTGEDINDSGVVVGFASTTNTNYGYRLYHAFKWSSGTLTDLTPNDTNELSMAHGINNMGVIVGYRTQSRAARVPLKWVGTTTTNLTTLGMVSGSEAYKIDDYGNILQNYTGDNQLFSNGQNYTLPILSGLGYFQPYDISITGSIAGNSSCLNSSYGHPVLWKPDYQNATSGKLYDIGTFGGNSGYAFSLNSWNVVVGYTASPTNSQIPFRWEEHTGLQNLNDLIDPGSGWDLYQALGINDKGQIICYGRYNGLSTGCLLTPVN